MKTLSRVEDAEEIRRRLGAVSASDEARWGVMSAAEMVCHLREAYAVALGETAVTMVKVPVPRGLYKWMALRTPMQWPKGVETVPELKRGRVTAPGEFAGDLAGAMDALARFRACTANRTTHAIFGEMKPADWMRWGYLHADHHLRQFGR